MQCMIRELPEHMSSIQLYIYIPGTTVFQWGIRESGFIPF